MRMPNATFVYAVLSGMLVVAIERMVATAQFRTYEKQASVVVAIVLVCFQVGYKTFIPFIRSQTKSAVVLFTEFGF